MNITPTISAMAQPINAPAQTAAAQHLYERVQQASTFVTNTNYLIHTNFLHRLQLETVAHLQHDRDDDSSLKGLSEHDKQSDDAENVRHTAVLN